MGPVGRDSSSLGFWRSIQRYWTSRRICRSLSCWAAVMNNGQRSIMDQLKDRLLRLTALRYATLPLLFENMRPDESLRIGDPVLLILKCHLLSEAVLDRLLELALEP